ncbi:hypothetical protein FM036_42465, partial [Nostoc sp. HG1]|nr:hypothetical protein [Nostoc sp. HG1]
SGPKRRWKNRIGKIRLKPTPKFSASGRGWGSIRAWRYSPASPLWRATPARKRPAPRPATATIWATTTCSTPVPFWPTRPRRPCSTTSRGWCRASRRFRPCSRPLSRTSTSAAPSVPTARRTSARCFRPCRRHPPLRLSPIICYESVYGDFVSEYARNGATLLGIITNDGWWSDSPGYRQHLLYGALRAIETRRDIARSANTGISGFINQKGEITQRTGWWVGAASRGVVHLNDELTFYVRYGELIGRGAQLLAVALLALTIFKFRIKP